LHALQPNCEALEASTTARDVLATVRDNLRSTRGPDSVRLEGHVCVIYTRRQLM
jgi:hypothetical protein